MTKKDRKEVIIVLAIIGLVLLGGLLSTAGYREKSVVSGSTEALPSEDFIINIGNENLELGSSSWSDAVIIFPGGQTMGMSTVYSAAPDDYLLTFTEKGNILCKADIYSSSIKTSRNLTTGMSFAQVKRAYGNNYVKISKQNDQDFDIIYGIDNNCIVFNIKDDKVWRIVIQRE